MFLTQVLNRLHNIGQNSVFTLLGLHPLLAFTADKLALKGKEIFVLQAIFHLKVFKFHTLIIL